LPGKSTRNPGGHRKARSFDCFRLAEPKKSNSKVKRSGEEGKHVTQLSTKPEEGFEQATFSGGLDGGRLSIRNKNVALVRAQDRKKKRKGEI